MTNLVERQAGLAVARLGGYPQHFNGRLQCVFTVLAVFFAWKAKSTGRDPSAVQGTTE